VRTETPKLAKVEAPSIGFSLKGVSVTIKRIFYLTMKFSLKVTMKRLNLYLSARPNFGRSLEFNGNIKSR